MEENGGGTGSWPCVLDARNARHSGKCRFIRSCCPIQRTDSWYTEEAGPRHPDPRAVAYWKGPDAKGRQCRTVAAIWTKGANARADRPLLVVARWRDDEQLVPPVCTAARMWSHDDAEDAGLSTGEDLRPYVKAFWEHAIAQVVVETVERWRARGATMYSRAIGAGRENTNKRGPLVKPIPFPGPLKPPTWAGLRPKTALDALVLAAANNALKAAEFRLNGRERTWWEQAEAGASTWHIATLLETDEGRERIRGKNEEEILQEDSTPAAESIFVLIAKTLTEVDKNSELTITDGKPVRAILVPHRLWRAIAEAGPNPNRVHPVPDPQAWWYVEIEKPSGDEPDAVVWWAQDEAKEWPTTMMAIWTRGEDASPHEPWIIVKRGEHWSAMQLSAADDVWSHMHACDEVVARRREALEGTTGVMERAGTAIEEHVERGENTPLELTPATYNPSTSTNTKRRATRTKERTELSVFVLTRAPDPHVDPKAAKSQGARHGDERAEAALHWVRAHWKQQPFGPGRTLRKMILVEGYERGREPGEEELEIRRMSENAPFTGAREGNGTYTE